MILDTSYLVDLVRGDAPARALLTESEGKGEPVRIPAPAAFEFWEGIERSRAPTRETELVDAVLSHHQVLSLTYAHARRAGRIGGYLARRGDAYNPLDVLIAAMAVEEGDVLVTRREREFARIPDVRVLTY